MKPLHPLTRKLSKHFPMHPSRQEVLSGLILGAINSSNVHHSSLSQCISSPTPQSAQRRTERFFAHESLDMNNYAKAIVELSGHMNTRFILCLDRTNWKFGESHMNYLVLSWRVNRHISLPLCFVELGKAGNSNTQERQELMEMFGELYGFERIEALMADREFIGEKWLKYLVRNKVPVYIQFKENMQVPFDSKGPIKLRKFFEHLKIGGSRLIEKEMYGTTVYFAGTRSVEGELVIVLTTRKMTSRKILKEYRKRWSIEELFRKLKSSGFNWESTHMTISYRLVSLLIIMSFAMFLVYLVGQKLKIPWKKTLGCPLRSVFRQGLIHLQFLIATSGDRTIDLLITLLERNHRLGD